jgi:hypothetical protein
MRSLYLALALLALPAAARAADPEPVALATVQGVVSKVDAEAGSLVVQPTGPDGKPSGKPVALKIAGTSNFFVVVRKEPPGKPPYLQQREVKARDLLPKQAVAVTYGKLKDDLIVLSAVAVPPPE